MGNAEDDGLNEYDRDKNQKQSLVLHTIASACTTSSQFADVQAIAIALESKKFSLGIQNLSGGYTNYTYKVFLVPSVDDEEQNKPHDGTGAGPLAMCPHAAQLSGSYYGTRNNKRQLDS
eukprot:scaffold20998_cov169-Skeletonema_marinoi.AAC.2